MFNFTDDYNTEFDAYIDDLYSQLDTKGYDVFTQELRCLSVLIGTEAYIYHTDRRPSPAQLDRMATLILKTDKKKRKGMIVAREEYPFLSERQYETRIRKESSFAGAGGYDSRGVSRNVPTRFNRIKTELKLKKVK